MTKAKPDAARTALIIPALNEEEVIARTIARVPRDCVSVIVVADNGSTDGTAAAARQAGALVVSEPRRGYGAACLRAIHALPAHIAVVVFVQADGSEDPAEIPLLTEPILEGCADLVIGSRTMGGAEEGSLTPLQRWGNRLATGMIRLLHGYGYTDLGPFRAIALQSLRRLDMREIGYGWTVEMQVKAVRAGLRIREVPVTYRKREFGVNKVSGNLKASVLAGLRILWTVLRLRLAPRL